MEMLFLCSLGWLGSRWARLSPARGTWSRIHALAQETGAKLALVGLGIVLSALAIVFSLSRSGITAALIGCGVFAVLVRPTGESRASHTIELGRSGRGRDRGYSRGKRSRFGHVYWAVALTVLAVAIWIGIDPVVSRFELVPEEWEAEQGRGQVWMDSLETAEDYWLTGSGLSSFRYVYPRYRSFGGRIFYSWAHNDYLQALIELGVPGLLLILWIMVGVWKGARRVRHRLSGNSGNLPLLHLHAGYCAAAVAVTLHSFTDFGLHMAANGALLGVIVGIVLGLTGAPKE
jgi:O-antigen ligase